MVKPSFEPAKGTRDWYGKETILRNKIRDTLTEVFERYGYDRLETPPIERRKALAFKGGGEIQKEVFSLEDQGGRELALRFDQTVPLSRYIASHPEIRFPFKRYVVGEVFRDGPTQPDQGRYRTFTQCDVDVLGIKKMSAEAELFALAQDAFRELGLGGVEVNINNRKLLEGILDYAGVPEPARLRTIVSLDKLDKIGMAGLEKELNELTLFNQEQGISDETLHNLFELYDQEGVNAIKDSKMVDKISGEVGGRGYQEIVKTFSNPEISDNRSSLFGEVANYMTSGELLLDSESIKKILHIAQLEGGNDQIFLTLDGIVNSKRGREGISEMGQLLNYSSDLGFDFIKLNPALARGLDYYTGTTIEVYLQDKSIVPSAILAGGRFDDMVGDFRGNGEEIPAVGFSFGLERLSMILNEQQKTPETVRQVYLVPIGKESQGPCLKVAHDLRNQGIKVDMELQGRAKIKKAVEYADKAGIPYVGFVGDTEIENRTLRLKELATGAQTDIGIEKVSEFLRRE